MLIQYMNSKIISLKLVIVAQNQQGLSVINKLHSYKKDQGIGKDNYLKDLLIVT